MISNFYFINQTNLILKLLHYLIRNLLDLLMCYQYYYFVLNLRLLFFHDYNSQLSFENFKFHYF